MTSPAVPFVSVLMPIRNEAAFIRRSLGAVLTQDYPSDRFEVIVADGRSNDGTREIVVEAAARDARVRVVDNPGRIVATGLNRAIAVARGEILVRIDGHCQVQADYVRRSVTHLLNDGVDGVGGPLHTVGETFTARAIAAAMSSRFGVGDSAFRTLTGRSLLVDTVAFPAYSREVLRRTGPFDEELVRNQDDEYNYRLRKMGGRLLLAHDVRSFYFSRSSLRSLWRQYFQYGYWKVRVLQKHPRQMRWRQFVPPLFVLTAMLSAVLTPWGAGRFMLFTVAVAYGAANLVASVLVSVRNRNVALAMLLPIAFAILHLSYGFGFFVGLVKFRARWGDRDTVSLILDRRVPVAGAFEQETTCALPTTVRPARSSKLPAAQS